jgi:DNA helicase HerA-like ATPase
MTSPVDQVPGSVYLGTAKAAAGPAPQYLVLKRTNRHGLIAGATGTGKTVSLQIMAEGLSAAGVPVFMADVKGDLAGMSQPGVSKDFLMKRAADIGFSDYRFEAFPVIFWDVFGEQGHPVRATISEMGPILLARLLELNDTQEGVLNIAFRLADEQGLLLLDLKDLQAMLSHVADSADELTVKYGNVSKTTIGAIQRSLLTLENQGATKFFGEPALSLSAFRRTAPNGYGAINILAADKLIQSPQLYATFLLWLLSELFEELPEIGDPDKPVLVFFFDEAHLLFNDAPKALLDRVANMVRLIRSKGVGVYFVTQNPQDVPDEVLGQLGNRVQHALRAYTPRDAKAVKTAAETFRPNPALDTGRVITELGVGEALVSMLDAGGVPSVVERTLIRPPSSRIGPVTAEERRSTIAASPIGTMFDTPIDRESAYERLAAKADKSPAQPVQESGIPSSPWGARPQAPSRVSKPAPAPRPSNRQSVGEAFAKSVVRSVGSQVGRQLIRGILGSLLKG